MSYFYPVFLLLTIHSPQSEHSFTGEEVRHPFAEGVFLFNKMEKICGIYKITSPSKKVYIGQSVHILKRFIVYNGLHCKEQTHLYNSFKKHGVDKHKFEIIEQCERKDLNEREKYYVDLFQTFNSKYGMNLRDGGGSKGEISSITKLKMKESRKNWRMSDRHKEILKASNRNRVYSPETKKKMSESAKKRPPISQATRKKLSENTIRRNLGVKFSEERKAKISIKAKGRVVSEETKQKIRNTLTGKNRGPYKNSTNYKPKYK